LVLENFIDLDKCKKLKTECDNIIESNRFLEEVEKISVFAADETPKPDLTRVWRFSLREFFQISLKNKRLNYNQINFPE
jgi:hypothetical protein